MELGPYEAGWLFAFSLGYLAAAISVSIILGLESVKKWRNK
jgi:hypothetical protein